MRMAGTHGFSYITIHSFRLSSAIGCFGVRSSSSLKTTKSFIRTILTHKALKVWWTQKELCNNEWETYLQKDKKEALVLIAWAWDRTVFASHEATVCDLLSYPRGLWREPRVPLSRIVSLQMPSVLRSEPLSTISTQDARANSLMYWTRGYSLPCQCDEDSQWSSGRGLLAMCEETMLLHCWHNVNCKFGSHHEFIYPPGWNGGLWLVGYK